MKTAARILNSILFVIFLFAALLALPGFFGIKMKAVTSGSMEPYISVGSLAVAVPAEIDELSVQDDVLYRLRNGAYVTHRIIELDREKGVVRTKGTANDRADPAVTADSIIGKVVLSVKGMGYVAVALSKTWVKVCVCVLLAILTAISTALDCKIRQKEKI